MTLLMLAGGTKAQVMYIMRHMCFIDCRHQMLAHKLTLFKVENMCPGTGHYVRSGPNVANDHAQFAFDSET